jgi:hypothetical protein
MPTIASLHLPHPSRRYAAAPTFLRREDGTINQRLPSRTIVVDQT